MTYKSGQVVLITLLVLTIATTIALSLIARTTTDTALTNQTQESSQAFSAAEAGIEEALKTGVGTAGSVTLVGAPNTTYAVTVATIGGATGPFSFSKKTLDGTTETLWLVPHSASSPFLPVISPFYTAPTIDVCWSSGSPSPAMAVTVLYKANSDGSYRVAKAAFDPDATRTPNNNFASPASLTGGCGDTVTQYKETLNFSSMFSINPVSDTLIALRLRPVYNDTNIVVNAPSPFVVPQQGNRIESTGSTTDTNRKIVVYQQYRAPSTAFDAALYSENSIVQ